MREYERQFDVEGHAAVVEEIRAAQDRIVRLSVQVELRAAIMVTLSVIFLGLIYAGGSGDRAWVHTSLVLRVAALLAAILAVVPALSLAPGPSSRRVTPGGARRRRGDGVSGASRRAARASLAPLPVCEHHLARGGVRRRRRRQDPQLTARSD